ncbi:MAG: GPI anchored serine-threonine rich family protein, partial [candidate division Zixibacteria bacterium]|nr:GPI anchored serine-threonine rich family protein [candidate division Zixibacteria bacterium]
LDVKDPGRAPVWELIAPVLRNTGEFEWEIPAKVSSFVKVRVLDARDADAMDESGAVFKILARFKFISPAVGDKLFVADRYEIRWETAGEVPSVQLGFAVSPGFEPPSAFKAVEGPVANRGSYHWTVPDAVSESVWLKISDAREPNAFQITPLPFKIRGKFHWKLPEGKLNWPVASQQTLQWETVGTIPRINLAYRLPQGKEWKTIAREIPNTGNFAWVIPPDVSDRIVLRVSDAANPEVFRDSAPQLVIAARFRFVSPAEGEALTVGSDYKIRWETDGHVPKIWLDYSAGDRWVSFAGPMADAGDHTWRVPDVISPHVQLRLRDGDNPDAFAVSAPFKVLGT